MSTTATAPSGLSARRARLAREIIESESKLQRLRAALEVRRKNLSRLDAQIALTGEQARGLRPHE